MSFRFVPHSSLRFSSQLALLTSWDKLSAGRRLPAFAELKLDSKLYDPKTLAVWNVEYEGRVQKFRAVYQGDRIVEAFNESWDGKTMEQVVPMSLRRIALDAANECINGACPVYAVYSTIDANDIKVECHRLLLPFGGDNGKVEQMLGSLQLTVIDIRRNILSHFSIHTDVVMTGRIKPGFTAPKIQLVTTAAKGREKRRASRRDVKRVGRISFAKQNLDCTVRNLSSTGAAIQVENVAEVPSSFRLMMETETAPRRCVVVWRKATQVGVKFT